MVYAFLMILLFCSSEQETVAKNSYANLDELSRNVATAVIRIILVLAVRSELPCKINSRQCDFHVDYENYVIRYFVTKKTCTVL